MCSANSNIAVFIISVWRHRREVIFSNTNINFRQSKIFFSPIAFTPPPPVFMIYTTCLVLTCSQRFLHFFYRGLITFRSRRFGLTAGVENLTRNTFIRHLQTDGPFSFPLLYPRREINRRNRDGNRDTIAGVCCVHV